jgi:nucleotide-binding universal stress UspA family protein
MFSSILWPVDGSPLSYAPVDKVIELAKMSSATVMVMSIAEPRLYRADDAEAVATGNEVEAAHLQAASVEVARIRSVVQDAGVACHAIVALSALPSAEIVNTARQRGCDLIVMATRGNLGVIESLFDPSCTRDVIAASRVPVLVFP